MTSETKKSTTSLGESILKAIRMTDEVLERVTGPSGTAVTMKIRTEPPRTYNDPTHGEKNQVRRISTRGKIFWDGQMWRYRVKCRLYRDVITRDAPFWDPEEAEVFVAGITPHPVKFDEFLHVTQLAQPISQR